MESLELMIEIDRFVARTGLVRKDNSIQDLLDAILEEFDEE